MKLISALTLLLCIACGGRTTKPAQQPVEPLVVQEQPPGEIQFEFEDTRERRPRYDPPPLTSLKRADPKMGDKLIDPDSWREYDPINPDLPGRDTENDE